MRPDRDLLKYRELILPVFTQWSRVGSITDVLADLEQGIFYDGALLVDQMLRDDRIRAVLDVRVNAVLGSPMHMEPADVRAGKKAESVAEEADDLWWDIAPRSELALLYRWGLMLGVGIARREWDGWKPRLKTWHPGALWFSLADDMYYLRYQGGQLPIDPEDPNWVLFTPYGYKYGRQQGLVRALAMPFLARQWAFRDRARHSERHGMPFLRGITPAEADLDEKKAFKRALAALGSETVIITPEGTDGNKWGADLIEAKSNSHEVFSAQIDHLDAAIAITVLGQSMSTTGQPGLGAQQKAGDSVRGDIKRFDAATLMDLGKRILQPWALYNHGDAELAPCPCFEVDPPADEQKKADTLSKLGDAIDKLEKHGLDARSLLEEVGVPMLTEAELAARKAEMVAEAQQAMQPEPDGDEGAKPKQPLDGDGDEGAGDGQ